MTSEFKPEYNLSENFRKQIRDEIEKVENDSKLNSKKKKEIIDNFLTNLFIYGR